MQLITLAARTSHSRRCRHEATDTWHDYPGYTMLSGCDVELKGWGAGLSCLVRDAFVLALKCWKACIWYSFSTACCSPVCPPRHSRLQDLRAEPQLSGFQHWALSCWRGPCMLPALRVFRLWQNHPRTLRHAVLKQPMPRLSLQTWCSTTPCQPQTGHILPHAFALVSLP